RADDDRLYDALANLPGDRNAIDRPLAQPSPSAKPDASASQADTHRQPVLSRPTELFSPAPVLASSASSARPGDPPISEGPATTSASSSRMPMFSQVSQDYIA